MRLPFGRAAAALLSPGCVIGIAPGGLDRHTLKIGAGTRLLHRTIAFDNEMREIPLVTLIEIKNAVDALSPAELAELVPYLRERDSTAWDAQIEQDAATGKLDFLFHEADAARNG